MEMNPKTRVAKIGNGILRFLTGQWFLLVLGLAAFSYGNWKFFYVERQDVCADIEDGPRNAACQKNYAEELFKYGSMNAENERGIPYPIFYVLPRVFPQCLPNSGVGGYRSLGLPWEEGRELPVGFSKRRLGFERITQTCAVCHTATYRMAASDSPTIVPTGPSHTTNVQSFFRFLECATSNDKFSHDGMWDEINRNFKMGLDDWLIYRALIPVVKSRVAQEIKALDWMESRPDWGPGRDDSMNLPKFILLNADPKHDLTTGNSDFPAIWNLSAREGYGLGWAGETPDTLAFIIDSALGLGAPGGPDFERQMGEIKAYLQRKAPPPYPKAPRLSEPDVMSGHALYKEHCADCHEFGGTRFGKVVPIEDIGSDRGRFDTLQQEDADGINKEVLKRGVHRGNMKKEVGYVSIPLTGLWLRAPYLHNGAVANLRELLRRPEDRLTVFYRGCDLYDDENMGFVSKEDKANCQNQFKFDTLLPGNGKLGHDYGTELSDLQKDQLLQYLKTL